jgi:hypothetical protein
VGGAALADPGDVRGIGDAVGAERERGEQPAAVVRAGGGHGVELVAGALGEAAGGVLAADGVRGVEVDEAGEAGRVAVGDAGDDHAAVAVADEHDLVQVLAREQLDDVLDVGLEGDAAGQQVGPVTAAGERGREDGVTCGLQAGAHPGPVPAARECAVDQEEGRHCGAEYSTPKKKASRTRRVDQGAGLAGDGSSAALSSDARRQPGALGLRRGSARRPRCRLSLRMWLSGDQWRSAGIEPGPDLAAMWRSLVCGARWYVALMGAPRDHDKCRLSAPCSLAGDA